ncbi:hypothetical protein [Microtetraspora malaysiensis]|uniref:hypothetical protein n=1 Tax=Microtetraspora malaysiensis TaxID=161358 RepID=UPI003D8D458A
MPVTSVAGFSGAVSQISRGLAPVRFSASAALPSSARRMFVMNALSPITVTVAPSTVCRTSVGRPAAG